MAELDLDGAGRIDILLGNSCLLNRHTFGVGSEAGLPAVFVLAAYPNPFNSRLNVRCDIPGSGGFHLGVYDLQGREILRLEGVGGRPGASDYSIDAAGWDSGVYLLRLSTAGKEEVLRAVLLK